MTTTTRARKPLGELNQNVNSLMVLNGKKPLATQLDKKKTTLVSKPITTSTVANKENVSINKENIKVEISTSKSKSTSVTSVATKDKVVNKENYKAEVAPPRSKAMTSGSLAALSTKETIKEVQPQQIKKKEITPAVVVIDLASDDSEDELDCFSSNNIMEKSMVENIDQDDDNMLACAEYVLDIFKYLKEKEIKFRPSANYLMEKQKGLISESTRKKTLEWIYDLTLLFELSSETFYLFTYLFDRMLSLVFVPTNSLQVSTAACLMIAMKVVEVQHLVLEDFVYVNQKAFTSESLVIAERHVLNILDFNVTLATPLPFIRRYCKASFGDNMLYCMTKYFSELCMLEHSFLDMLPSEIAAASVYVARRVLMPEQKPWRSTLVHYTDFTEDEILPCARKVHALACKTHKLVSSGEFTSPIINRYMTDSFFNVASISIPPL